MKSFLSLKALPSILQRSYWNHENLVSFTVSILCSGDDKLQIRQAHRILGFALSQFEFDEGIAPIIQVKDCISLKPQPFETPLCILCT